jgi:indolepyruvate decarboxylase
VPEVLGSGLGIRVETEIEMDAALKRARDNVDGVSIIQVMLDRNDHSPALLRLTATLGERARGKA